MAKPKTKVKVTPKAPAPAPDSKGPRQFTPDEILELQELHRVVGAREFEARQVRGNTLLIPDGMKFAEQLEALARLLANTKQHWIAQKLAEAGWSPEVRVSIDMKTGLITPAVAGGVLVVPPKKA